MAEKELRRMSREELVVAALAALAALAVLVATIFLPVLAHELSE